MFDKKDIRNPELKKLLDDNPPFNSETAMRIILVVDNVLNIMRRETGNDNALLTRRVIGIEEGIDGLRRELQNERISRNQTELLQAERAVEMAKKRIGLTTDAKLEVRRIFEESLREGVTEEIEEVEEKRTKERKRWWNERVLPGLTTALIAAIVVPIGLALFILIIRLIAKAFGLELL